MSGRALSLIASGDRAIPGVLFKLEPFLRGCRCSGVAIILVIRDQGVRCRFVVISVREIRCGHVHGRRRLDDEIIGVDVRSQRVDDVVKGSLVRLVDVPSDSVTAVPM